MRHSAKIERADIIGCEQLEDFYNAETSKLHETYCADVDPGAVMDRGTYNEACKGV